MNDEEFGTTAKYRRALETVRAEGIADNHLALLWAHYSAPRHTATWAQLAAAVGYANRRSVHSEYGKFARLVAHAMGISAAPKGFWLYVLAGWAEDRDAVSGHTAFTLRRPVIEAIKMLGLLADPAVMLLPDEMEATAPMREGASYQELVNTYERHPEARRKCIAAHGNACCICGFSFGTVYGPEAEASIHVHLKPLSGIGGEYVVDPVEDLRPVCPNCHAVIHHGGRLRGIEEVRQLLARQRQAETRAALDPAPR